MDRREELWRAELLNSDTGVCCIKFNKERDFQERTRKSGEDCSLNVYNMVLIKPSKHVNSNSCIPIEVSRLKTIPDKD